MGKGKLSNKDIYRTFGLKELNVICDGFYWWTAYYMDGKEKYYRVKISAGITG